MIWLIVCALIVAGVIAYKPVMLAYLRRKAEKRRKEEEKQSEAMRQQREAAERWRKKQEEQRQAIIDAGGTPWEPGSTIAHGVTSTMPYWNLTGSTTLPSWQHQQVMAAQQQMAAQMNIGRPLKPRKPTPRSEPEEDIRTASK